MYIFQQKWGNIAKFVIMGRPTKYNEEIAYKICTEIAEGASLRKICSNPDMPSIDSVRRWLIDEDKAVFHLQYARAREEQADFYADEITEIADTEPDPNRARVRVDARKWVASKLKPKKYGEKLDLTSGGEKLQPPSWVRDKNG